ncbi:MAG: VIT and vWA domain-containing protein [Pirellulaceae bacterium]
MNRCRKINWVRGGLVAAAAAILLSSVSARVADAAGLLVADNGFGGALVVKQHDVRVVINNGIAVTEVEQVFENTENRIVEALYTFPVPKNASVSNFSMWINGSEMIGEVVEKKRAREIYESYKEVRRDPGLLEQVDYKRFEMRIFPIPANAEQRVKITYAQELDYDHDTATYVYPMATVAASTTAPQVADRFSLSLEAKSEVAVVEMYSPSHGDEFAIVKHSHAYWQASLERRQGDLSRDLVVVYKAERAQTGIDLVASKHSGEDGYFLLTMTAGKELEATSGGSDYVFVLDISGSMAEDGKLAMSRGSVERFVAALDDQDSVELITFNIRPTTLFGNLQPATAETKAAAEQFLKAQRGVGGTILRPALETAYRYHRSDRPLNVVLLSDGMTEQSEQALLVQLIGQRPAGVTVFCVGVGNEVNRPLLTQLADEAGGLVAFVSAGDDFERQAQAFRRKLVRPAAKQVKLTFEGGDVYDLEPPVLPNLYYGQPIRLYGRYRNSGPVKLQVQAEIQGSPMEQKVVLDLPSNEESNPQIDRMWASHRVERLLNRQRAGAIDDQISEVVRLCEGYSIVSQYASFLVLENDAEYQRWQIARRNATRIERDRDAQARLRQRLDQLQLQASAQLGPQEPTEVIAGSPDAPTQNLPTTPPSFGTPVGPGNNVSVSSPQNSSKVSQGGGSRGAGGGAIDPLTALLGLGMAGMGIAARYRKRK